MSDIQQIQLTFDDECSINADDFIEWFRVFRSAYAVAMHENSENVRPDQVKAVLESDADLNTNLEIVRLSKSSPMEVVLLGEAIALTAAVIFSGGIIKVGEIEVKLRPMGVGVKSMREALKDNIDEPRMGL